MAPPLADLLRGGCSWPVPFHSATIVVLCAIVDQHGSLSGFRSWAKWLLHCVLALLIFALAASPYFILNTFEFGHPLKTGYDFWVPCVDGEASAVSLA